VVPVEPVQHQQLVGLPQLSLRVEVLEVTLVARVVLVVAVLEGERPRLA
jgi:hypothetical protein